MTRFFLLLCWVLANLWLLLILVLFRGHVPSDVSLYTTIVSGLSIFAALWLLHKEIKKMFK
jgi:hypothetical protein